MIKDNVTVYDDLNESYGTPYGFGYHGYIFVFDTKEERDEWLEDCTIEDIEYIINDQEENVEG
ncbi:hypothetical protein GAP32_401 [Cronobacter phage vB_CsaM_GAP32]|uniref:Uncharacterized protein n=1 Tax=Cronobacter phage vB_CsaM_GAP32 TaxID=1141136 RepID=K4FB75_9CAUD|nr:hypothetical protein GAP32_401 [Cronobacter phage vB_CsaM_GAP32]AFC21854.1 hypothetical protein GAP32_401 [Cronobacter phage vB_CsaM_GAP32]